MLSMDRGWFYCCFSLIVPFHMRKYCAYWTESRKTFKSTCLDFFCKIHFYCKKMSINTFYTTSSGSNWHSWDWGDLWKCHVLLHSACLHALFPAFRGGIDQLHQHAQSDLNGRKSGQIDDRPLISSWPESHLVTQIERRKKYAIKRGKCQLCYY